MRETARFNYTSRAAREAAAVRGMPRICAGDSAETSIQPPCSDP